MQKANKEEGVGWYHSHSHHQSTTAVQRFGPQKPFNIPANSVFFWKKKKKKNSNHDNSEQKGKEKKPRVGCFNSQAHIIRNIFFIHRNVSYIRS